jgi:hypothetical protein
MCVDRFCLNIGWLYTRLVASNSNNAMPETDTEQDDPDDESALLPRRLNNSVEEFMAMYAKSPLFCPPQAMAALLSFIY